MMFPFSIILGFGTGFQPVAGFNYGAKRFDRVHESYRFCSRVALIGSLIMAVFVGLFADTFVVLFAGTDEEMRRIGVICMVSQCIALPVHAWVAIINMLCAGLGNAKGALALSTSRQGTCFLPILYPLAWAFGAYGIACVQAIADILTLVLAVPILKKTRKAVNAAEQAWLAEQNQ
jgi:Na+-driven multidrug efflux pump